MKQLKLIVLSIAIVVVSLRLYAQPFNDWHLQRLNGKVKSMVILTYHVTPSTLGPGKHHNADEVPLFGRPSRTYYYYNEEGNLTEIASYDKHKNQVERTVFKYDEKGYRLEGDHYVKQDSLDYTFSYRYNIKGYRTERTLLNVKDSLSDKEIYKYDEANKITGIDYLDVHDSLVKQAKFSYNEQAEITEFEIFKNDGTLQQRNFITYEKKDKKGNWQKEISLTVNGGYATMQVRKLEYYN